MRLQAEGTPDTGDRSLVQADGLGHAPRAPVGGTPRSSFEGLDHDLLYQGVNNLSRSALALLVGQAIEPVGKEAYPPLALRYLVEIQPAATTLLSIPAAQSKTIQARCEALRPPRPTGRGIEFFSLVIGQSE